jgi:flagellum-specific ATP synthase
VLESISRVRGEVLSPEQLKAARRVLALLGTYREIEDMVSVGAYVPGVNIEFDVAVQARPKILQYLQQESSVVSGMEQTKKQLMDLVNWIEQLEKALRAQAAKPAGRK